jgi:hypothetical protein
MTTWNDPPAERDPRAAGRREPRAYVTEISVPYFGDGGVQRLHAPMKQPEPEPEAESGPYPLMVSKPAEPGPEAACEPEASL